MFIRFSGFFHYIKSNLLTKRNKFLIQVVPRETRFFRKAFQCRNTYGTRTEENRSTFIMDIVRDICDEIVRRESVDRTRLIARNDRGRIECEKESNRRRWREDDRRNRFAHNGRNVHRGRDNEGSSRPCSRKKGRARAKRNWNWRQLNFSERWISRPAIIERERERERESDLSRASHSPFSMLSSAAEVL